MYLTFMNQGKGQAQIEWKGSLYHILYAEWDNQELSLWLSAICTPLISNNLLLEAADQAYFNTNRYITSQNHQTDYFLNSLFSRGVQLNDTHHAHYSAAFQT